MEKTDCIGMELRWWRDNYPLLVPHIDKIDKVSKWVSAEDLKAVLELWNAPERHYHNIRHMAELFEQYDAALASGIEFTQVERDVLLCAIFYHDAVYDPRATNPNNEDESIRLWSRHFIHKDTYDHRVVFPWVNRLIEATKHHSSVSGNGLEKLFVKWDLWSLASDDLTVLIDAERRIFKEYQMYDYEVYREARIKILIGLQPFVLELNPESKIESLIQYISARKLRIGIFAGTFWPMHAGHYSILKRAEQVFDKVIIACGKNPLKPDSLERDAYINKLRDEILPYHQVESFDGLLNHYVQSKRTNYVEPSIVKGLGRANDYEDEKMLMRYMEDEDPTINTAFFISDRRFDYVSSMGAKVVLRVCPEMYDCYVLGQWPDAERKLK